jgi:hypothetical protein
MLRTRRQTRGLAQSDDRDLSCLRTLLPPAVSAAGLPETRPATAGKPSAGEAGDKASPVLASPVLGARRRRSGGRLAHMGATLIGQEWVPG